VAFTVVKFQDILCVRDFGSQVVHSAGWRWAVAFRERVCFEESAIDFLWAGRQNTM
jgi:hypothetical protein